MKALITGANGFVGGHLVDLLLKNGFELFGLDRSKSDIKWVKSFNADITDEKEVSRVIKECVPDYIFHLAAISSVKLCSENPELARKVNVTGTESIIRACAKNGINPTILVTSSAYVYGVPQHTPIDENHPTNPIDPYGKSKLEQENISLKLFEETGIKVIISRSFNHIGSNQGTGFACSDFAKQIAEIEKGISKPEIHVGNLNPKRDFSDVRDIVKAYLLLLQKGKPGEVYNIGSGKSYSMRHILDVMLSKSTAKIKIVEDKDKFRKAEIPILEANNKKFTDLTGWKPEFSIEQSLSDVLDYWRHIVK